MRPTKLIFKLGQVAIVAVAMLLITTTIFAQGINLSPILTTKVNQKVYQGVFDITQPGDVIIGPPEWQHHWKKIDIREITLNKMPAIQVYVKPHTLLAGRYPSDSWITGTVTFDDDVSIVVKDRSVYIRYKNGASGSNDYTYLTNGEYKIVVTY